MPNSKAEVASSLSEIDNFERLARPTINPTLSDYITGLTGITQRDVDGA